MSGGEHAERDEADLDDRLRALRVENEELRQHLSEAEETAAAIRQGEVDAFVVGVRQGERVLSLRGANTPISPSCRTCARAPRR